MGNHPRKAVIMPQRKVCRLHGHTLMSCRCPCADRATPIDCNDWCPDYGKPPVNEVEADDGPQLP